MQADTKEKVKKKKVVKKEEKEEPAHEPEPEPPAPAAAPTRSSTRHSSKKKAVKRSGSNVFSMFSTQQVAEFKEVGLTLLSLSHCHLIFLLLGYLK